MYKISCDEMRRNFRDNDCVLRFIQLSARELDASYFRAY